MAYTSRNGRRAPQFASRASHSQVIRDETVQKFLKNCELPKTNDEIHINPKYLHPIDYSKQHTKKHVVAVDGGFTTVAVKRSFPSSTVTFFQFGALWLELDKLDTMMKAPFISTEAMQKLKGLDRSILVLPTKNLPLLGEIGMENSIRATISQYLMKDIEGDSLMKTLAWLVFREYKDKPENYYMLASCPSCERKDVQLTRASINSGQYQSPCPSCKQPIFLSDIFRLHELVDEEGGGGGIIGFLANAAEHLHLVHIIRTIHENHGEKMNDFLFIKDGPLAFFAQTANIHQPMRDLCIYLNDKYNFCLVGLEKSGTFADHAHEVKDQIPPGHAYLLSNKHIYGYILPGDPDKPEPYARSSYYSGKVLFKAKDDRLYVATIPTASSHIVLDPKPNDFFNLNVILSHIDRLKCDMYDDAILPISLANKLISLSNQPSSKLLERFAKEKVNRS